MAVVFLLPTPFEDVLLAVLECVGLVVVDVFPLPTLFDVVLLIVLECADLVVVVVFPLPILFDDVLFPVLSVEVLVPPGLVSLEAWIVVDPSFSLIFVFLVDDTVLEVSDEVLFK